ncbi:MAG: ABC transporter ATP-binding protein [Alphaproteobacteria bacterium]|nr:ABC transporter ATP-binding protein [Alphaproteobacteria bacterium]
MNETKDIAIEVVGLSKSYGPVRALRSVDIAIGRNEYFVLLGPSGGGKTTLLRMIGGFTKPTAGRILLHGVDVAHLPPDKRPTCMVFQSYALFPHMTVAGNVGYGLKLKGMSKAEIQVRLDAVLEMVGLNGYQARMPWELSGGQQQRVQLARALVLEPEILLLDEPLAALDEQLRKDMCIWLKHLQERVGITFIHVTHNQEEAMSVADRIALIADGELVECGDARQVYRTPARRFTASFMGESNLLDGTVAEVSGDGTVTVDVGIARVAVPSADATAGIQAAVSVRSEAMRLIPRDQAQGADEQALDAIYQEEIYLGLMTRQIMALPNGQTISVRSVSDDDEAPAFQAGDAVRVVWKTAAGRLHLS